MTVRPKGKGTDRGTRPANSLAGFLGEPRVVDLSGRTRSRVFRELAAHVAVAYPDLTAGRIVRALEAREKSLSTRMSEEVAIPHAVLPVGRTRVVLGRSRSGVDWDGQADSPIRLVALMVGPRGEHLSVLASIAARLNRPGLVRAVLDASTPERAFEWFMEPEAPPADSAARRLSSACFRQALALAAEASADAVVLHADVGLSFDLAFPDTHAPRLIIVSGDPAQAPRPRRAKDIVLLLPFTGHDRVGQMDVALLYAVSQGAIRPHERVVSVCGVPGSGLLDTIRMADLAREYRHFLALDDDILPRDLEQQVLLRTLQLAAKIAQEGREGDAVGTIFVVGDYGRVRRHCRQMIINPFYGCADDARNILDPGLEETIKEFARLDGAFIVRGDGRIVSAGTFLRTDAPTEDLPKGLGARHAAAAAISVATRTLAVAVSQSTRRVSLFKQGRRILSFQP